ncbi:pathogen-associated molecular patterns-induced protein A70 [Vigna angularis]|nr:pathogen-associated molecular patterns-induced protein A70 [Vigna angularis]
MMLCSMEKLDAMMGFWGFSFSNWVLLKIGDKRIWVICWRNLEGSSGDNSPQLDRVPSSSLMDRIRSFSFRRTESERSEPVQNSESGMNLVRTPSLLEHVRRFSPYLGKVQKESCDLVEQQLSRAPFFLQRLKSLTFDRSESEAEVRDGGEFVEEREEEEGVDAKADDFINRFRQQLRLQRLDSILRCRDMLTRNS